MDEISVDYIDGFLRGISTGCHACDYVPFYGATEFSHLEQSIKDSLKVHLGIQTPAVRYPREFPLISNYVSIEPNEWKSKLNSVLANWVDSKSKYNEEFIEIYKDDLLEQINETVGSSPECFYANVEHENFEMGNEILGFVGEGKAFYLHFSFSD
jgi:hypothetical protein